MFISCYDENGYYSNDNLIHLIKWTKEVLKFQKPENKWKIIIESTISLKYILSILNSRLNTYYFSKFISSDTLQGSYSSIYPEDIRVIPIKDISLEKQTPLVDIVDEIINLKKQNPKADTAILEKEIDQIVYKLYELTEEEIRIVESCIN